MFWRTRSCARFRRSKIGQTQVGKRIATAARDERPLRYIRGQEFVARLERPDEFEIDGDPVGEVVAFKARIDTGGLRVSRRRTAGPDPQHAPGRERPQLTRAPFRRACACWTESGPHNRRHVRTTEERGATCLRLFGGSSRRCRTSRSARLGRARARPGSGSGSGSAALGLGLGLGLDVGLAGDDRAEPVPRLDERLVRVARGDLRAEAVARGYDPGTSRGG